MDAAGKPARKPAVFDIDYGLCMNCGMCEEVCPFDSIFMDHAFEVTAPERGEGLGPSQGSDSRNRTNISRKSGRRWRPPLIKKRKAAEEKKKAAAQTTAAPHRDPNDQRH